jgi:protocatechuate 3,4-dioxygenase beta subunit
MLAAIVGRATVAASSQTLPTGLIIGHVTDGLTNRSLQGVTVALTGAGPAVRVLVDSQGRFMFRNVPKGRYSLTASKPGFADGALGKVRPDGTGQALDFTDGQRITDLVIPIWRYASISGRIADESNESIAGQKVLAYRRTVIAGHWDFVQAAVTLSDDLGAYRVGSLLPGEYVIAVRSTDAWVPVSAWQQRSIARDAGQESQKVLDGELSAKNSRQILNGSTPERIGGFTHSRIDGVIPTPLPGEPFRVFPTTLHPSAITAGSAQVVTVGIGESRAGVDVQMQLTRSLTISGAVVDQSGAVPNMGVELWSADEMRLPGPIATAMADASGRFMFAGIVPGRYALRAHTSPPLQVDITETTLETPTGTSTTSTAVPSAGAVLSRTPTVWGMSPVTVVDRDVENVSLTLQNGARISGRVAFEGSAPLTGARLQATRLTVEPADGRLQAVPGAYRVQVLADGSFYTSTLPPGQYYIRAATPPAGWTLVSAMFNGRDASSDAPISLNTEDATNVVLTFRDHAPTLSGTVRHPQGQADTSAFVVIFPVDANSRVNAGVTPRRLTGARVDALGAFSIVGVPLGDYFVAALSDRDAANWSAPDRLEQIARVAKQVHVAETGAAVDLVTPVVK